MLAGRLATIGATWESIHAVILTQTHGDHWKDTCFAQFRRRRVPLYAHPAHLDQLNGTAESFGSLHASDMTRTYSTQPIELSRGLTCRAIEVSHDAEPTFAFRLDFREEG